MKINNDDAGTWRRSDIIKQKECGVKADETVQYGDVLWVTFECGVLGVISAKSIVHNKYNRKLKELKTLRM